MRSRDASVIVVFAALYSILVVGLAPISFLPIQVRLADALIPFTVIYGAPASIGLALGAAVGNFVGGQLYFGGWALVDVVGGSVANLLAGYVGWWVGRGGSRRRRVAATLIQTLIISLIVGSYLWLLLGAPERFTIPVLDVEVPGLPAFWITIGFGSIVAIVFVGNILLESFLRMTLGGAGVPGSQAQEFVVESVKLAVAMTSAPITLLVFLWFTGQATIPMLTFWTAFAFAWTLTLALLYHRRGAPKRKRH